MAKKKTNITINTGQEEFLSSSFLVDLKKSSPSFPTSDFTPSAKEFKSKAIMSDFVPRQKKKINWPTERFRELLFFPILEFLYRFFFQFIKFFSRQIKKHPELKEGKEKIKKSFSWFKFRVKKQIKEAEYKFNAKAFVAKRQLEKELERIKQPLLLDKLDYLKEKEGPKARIEDLPRESMLKDVDKKTKKQKNLLYFILALLIIVVPLKLLTYYKFFDFSSWQKEAKAYISGALGNLKDASQSAAQLDLASASQRFSLAAEELSKLEAELKSVDELVFLLASFSQNEKLKAASEGKDIIAAGLSASRLGNNLSLALNTVFSKDEKKNIPQMIDKFNYFASLALGDLKDLNKNLKKVEEEKLPADLRANFSALKEKSILLEDALAKFLSLSEELNDFLGVGQDKRYLLVFQNNNELRASGGFLGSYALIDFSRGEIKNLEVPAGGSYDTEGGLRVLVEAPKPLHLVNPLWHFWDANWWPDWETSAKNLMWFYEKSSGPSVDGVISFTPTVIENLLEITGPIDMTKDYGVVIDKDNFWSVTQGLIEKTGNPELYSTSSPWGQQLAPEIKDQTIIGEQNQPKKIIGDLMNKIISILPTKFDQENFVKIFKALDKSLAEKQILLYFTNHNLQEKIKDNSWAGEVKSSPSDYLMVVNTNIGGQKSDRLIEESIKHEASFAEDGSILVRLKIIREHKGTKGTPFTGVRNVDWLRVYVPLGSQLISASGFNPPPSSSFEEPLPGWQKNPLVEKTEGRAVVHEDSGTSIYFENRKTVFANWLMLDPGEKREVVLEYKLPFGLKKELLGKGLAGRLNQWLNKDQAGELYAYSLLIQKQPGAKASWFESSLKSPENHSFFWKYPENLAIMEGSWEFKADLAVDRYYKLMWLK